MRTHDIVVSQVVAAPLEAVWESWADFGGIDRFHEDVRKTTVLTVDMPRGVGAVRRCELADGTNEIEERVVEWEPMRKLGVEFKRTTLPIEKAHVDFLFEALKSDQTKVEMRCSFTPRGWVLRFMKPIMRGKMQRGFERLLKSNMLFLEAD